MPTPSHHDLELLSQALWDRDFEVASKLLRSGLSLDDILDDDGDSFLHNAAQDGDIEMVAFFLQSSCPRTLASFDYIAQTPLIRAADHGHLEIVRRLISAGADVNAHNEDQIGNTAIREAVRGGHVEVVRVLLDAGADPTIPGWMGISAVDQAYYEVDGGLDSADAQEVRELLSGYRSPLREQFEKRKKRDA